MLIEHTNILYYVTKLIKPVTSVCW